MMSMMYMNAIRYSTHMDVRKTEVEVRIADARNGLADVINRARYLDEVTVLTHRKKRVAAVVSIDFYERALEALGEERVPASEEPSGS